MKATLLSAFLLIAATGNALAGSHVYGPFPADYVEECGSCHVAFPPQLLTAPGWQRVMEQLDKHYGADASLEDKRRTAIADFLRRSASTRDKHAPTEASARLSRTAWFAREHGPTPPAKVSFAECTACHTAADRGDYSERSIKLPAGWRRAR